MGVTLSLGMANANSVYAEAEVKTDTRILTVQKSNDKLTDNVENENLTDKKETNELNNTLNSNEEVKGIESETTEVSGSEKQGYRKRIIKILIVDVLIIIGLIFIKVYKTKKDKK